MRDNANSSLLPLDIQKAFQAENEAIYGILMKIRKKWHIGIEVKEEELKETVFLSPGGDKKEPPAVEVRESREELPETVIISLTGADKDALGFSRGLKSKDLHSLEETVLQEKEKLECTKKNIRKPDEQDFLAETVIFEIGKVQDKGKYGTKD